MLSVLSHVATIFVYGQTASGKSFTMLGDGNETNQSFGIIPSSLFEMFDLFGQVCVCL